MSREYVSGLASCKGDCGHMLRAVTAAKQFPEAKPRYARGMCAGCYEKTYRAPEEAIHPDRVREVAAELDYYLADRRARGIPAEGLTYRSAS